MLVSTRWVHQQKVQKGLGLVVVVEIVVVVEWVVMVEWVVVVEWGIGG